MKIAINAADLDHERIDGTRIYIKNLLDNFGSADREQWDQFLIYHKSEFNPELEFKNFVNYKIKKIPFPFWWTQTRFAWEILCEKPEVLWMPMHVLPYFRPQKTKTVVTIHDLAFKIFPQYFPQKDLRRLNYFTDYAVQNADRLIAVSQSTKNDLLHFYPGIEEENIRVIYHGCDGKIFNAERDKPAEKKFREKYNLGNAKYLITVGAIQPRKNLDLLVDAFLELKKSGEFRSYKLVIAGCPAWQSDQIIKKIKSSEGIIITGNFATRELPNLLKGAEIFVSTSLYEGFGLPLLEAMASGVPAIAPANSSLKEIIQNDEALFKGNNPIELSRRLQQILQNDKLKNTLREKGLERASDFSWEKCAKETLEWMKS